MAETIASSLKPRTVSSFGLLHPDEVQMFAQAIRTDKYDLVVEAPSEGVRPQDIFPFQMTDSYYANILNDPGAHYLCFLVCFKGSDDQLLRLPMGIFGVSPKNRIRFPVLLSGVILNFLNMSEDTFVEYIYSNKAPGADKDKKWRRLYLVRRQLIKRVLLFYTQLGEGYSSAMAWKNRAKGSITREVGESLPFYVRAEDTDADAEYYYSRQLTDAQIAYVKDCYERFSPRNEKKKPLVRHELTGHFKFLLSVFIKNLVNTSANFSF